MALKDEKGRYHRITGMFFQYGKIEVRLAKNYDEEERREEPEEAKYFNEPGIVLPKELEDLIKTEVYKLLKAHKTNIRTVKIPAEYNKDGELVKEASEETTFDQPYINMIDC